MATELKLAQIESVAERLGAHEFRGWFYGDSIGFEGLLAATDMLNNPRWLHFTHGFFRAWATRMEPFQPDDNTAPGHIMCDVIERTGDQILQHAVISLAQNLHGRRKIDGVSITFEDTRRSLRTPYGGIELSAAEQNLMQNPGAGIWLDCMHFDPPFFAHLAHIDPDGGWEQAAIAELLGYQRFLLNKETGLYRHFWLEKVDNSYTDGWGRGQGWALLGLLDVAHQLPNAPGTAAVRDEALRLARKMLSYQLADGNWYCMVHEPRSGPESSTAAFMATAFYRGLANELLPTDEFEEPANRAFQAMCANLDADGNLMGVSAAVYSALVEQHYWHVPLDRIVPWGQGPVLTAALARQVWLKRN